MPEVINRTSSVDMECSNGNASQHATLFDPTNRIPTADPTKKRNTFLNCLQFYFIALTKIKLL